LTQCLALFFRAWEALPGRGIQKNLTYVAGRAQLTYELRLNEAVFDFYDRLKSIDVTARCYGGDFAEEEAAG
jgi:translation elongation factor EF-4